MARQPSLRSDYISVLLRAIEETKNDPAQLRSLVYEVARISLGKQILLHRNKIGSAELHEHLYSLETAIKNVEGLLEDDERAVTNRADVHLIDNSARPNGQNTAVVYAGPAGVTIDDGPGQDKALVIRSSSGDFYYEAHPLSTSLQSSQIGVPAQASRQLPKRVWSDTQFTLQLLIAAIIGLAIYVGFIDRFNYPIGPEPPPPADLAQSPRSAPGMQDGRASRAETHEPAATLHSANVAGMPNFTLPTLYGVYAESGGKLWQLESLPIRVPDPRIAISTMISQPSPTTIPSGKIAFVAFRRDLISSAPDKVLVRVVARIVREMKFSGVGPPKITTIDDQWVVRSNSYEFDVAPLDDNPEMILIRAARPDFSLPAGRYALVLKGQAFDFDVAGQTTDAAHCLERTDAVESAVYSECRHIP